MSEIEGGSSNGLHGWIAKNVANLTAVGVVCGLLWVGQTRLHEMFTHMWDDNKNQQRVFQDELKAMRVHDADRTQRMYDAIRELRTDMRDATNAIKEAVRLTKNGNHNEEKDQ